MKKVILLSLILIIFVSGILFVLNQKRRTQIGLEGFYELTLKDPLFYSPFFDREEFEKAIEGLETEETELKEIIIAEMEEDEFKTDYISILKENSLFPYQFLRNLISVNQKTEEFLQNPSVKQAEGLLSLYDMAADSYIEDISSKIKILEKIDPDKDNPIFFFMVDSTTNSQVIKDDYYIIKENGDKLKEEVIKRKNCLSGKEDCRKLIKTKDSGPFLSLVESMENEEFDLRGEKIDFIKSNLPSTPPAEEKRVRGPYKIKSFCWQNLDFEHWMYLIYYKENGRMVVLPKLANKNYYMQVTLKSDSGFLQALSKEGVEFILQSEATTYECMDLTFYPQLLTLDFLKEKIEKGLITKEDLEKNLDYKLLIENQFGLLAPAINTFSAHLNFFKSLRMTQTISSFSPGYLLVARAGYSIFSFPFAKSIWRIDKELKYFLPEKERPNAPHLFTTLEELKKMGYSDEAIQRFHLNQLDFINSLIY